MNYFLDANICIYYLKGINENIKNILLAKHPDNIKIPSIVKAGLLYGVEKSKKRDENIEKVIGFLLPFEIVSFGNAEAYKYSKLRAKLEKEGNVIGPNGLLIASIVLANDGILVTNNINEFNRIKKLKIENWLE